MDVVRSGQRSETYGGRFTGRVELEMLGEARWAEAPDVARVHFADGAATNWHRHPGGQVLYLVAGLGRTGDDAEGEVILEPGDAVFARPDERHWHGAAAGRDCTFLAVTWGTTDWEDVAPETRDG